MKFSLIFILFLFSITSFAKTLIRVEISGEKQGFEAIDMITTEKEPFAEHKKMEAAVEARFKELSFFSRKAYALTLMDIFLERNWKLISESSINTEDTTGYTTFLTFQKD